MKRFVDNVFSGDACSLLAIPSECNFSGTRFNLDHVRAIKEDFGRQVEGHNYHRLTIHIQLRIYTSIVDAVLSCFCISHKLGWLKC